MTDTLMVGVSGVRGIVGKDLTDEVVMRYARAFGMWAAEHAPLVVVGRDARTSGPAFERAVTAGLGSVGCDVVTVGLAPTPTIQLAVEHHAAGGGIAITASHNPIEWNALKFIGPDGIFLDGAGARKPGRAVRAGAPHRRRRRDRRGPGRGSVGDRGRERHGHWGGLHAGVCGTGGLGGTGKGEGAECCLQPVHQSRRRGRGTGARGYDRADAGRRSPRRPRHLATWGCDRGGREWGGHVPRAARGTGRARGGRARPAAVGADRKAGE